MNRWAANNPEAYERGERMEDAYIDAYDRGEFDEPAPCRVCGEVLTRGGRTCPRCAASMEEDRLERESNR